MISKIICLLSQHKWGNFAYDAINSCWQRRYCIRCGEEDIMEAPHNYEQWKYEDNGCSKVRVCQRCEKKETVENHEGSEISISAEYIDNKICEKQRICQRCGRVIATEISFHAYRCIGKTELGWDGGDYHDGKGRFWYLYEYRCRYCGDSIFEEG